MSRTARSRKRIPCTAAILAGGMSSRMGQLKQDVLLADGRTMIEWVHDAMTPLCDRVVIVGECAELPDCERVRDLRADQGPLGGIEALLASNMDEQYLICPCDMPRVTSDLLALLLAESSKQATTFNDRPLPVRLSADALPIVQRLLDEGQRAVWRLMEMIGAQRVAIPGGGEGLLRNMNSPKDVQSLREKRSPADRG